MSRVQALTLSKRCKNTSLGNQFIIRSVFGDFAAVDDQDAVAVLDGGEAVGDDDASALHLVQGFGDLALGDVIQGAGGLVEDEDLGLGGDGAGDHEALALAAGDGAAAVLQHGVHAHGHIPDVVSNAGDFRGFPGFVQLQGWV